jgi:hypothetical protein
MSDSLAQKVAMKLLLALLLLCLPVCAQVNVTLAWDADSDPDVIGYLVSVDDEPEVMVGDAEFAVQLAKGVHTATVKAVDYRMAESLPAVFEFTVQEFALVTEESDDQQAWTVRNRETILTAKPNKFYRLRLLLP